VILSADKSKSIFWIFAGLFIAFLLPAVFTGEYFWMALPFGIALSYFGWQHINVLFFLLLATLPFSAEYHFSAELGTDIPDEFLMLITAALFSLYFIYKPGILSKKCRRHPLLLLLLFSIAWTLITVLF
jgi:hypothetical protein